MINHFLHILVLSFSISTMLKFQSAIFSHNPIPEESYCTGHSETIVLNVPPKLPLTLRGQRFNPMYAGLLLPLSPKLHIFHSTASRFWVTGHFDTSTPNDPKMTLCTKRSNVPPYTYKYSRVTNFMSFRSTDSCFWVTGHFDTSAQMTPNDLKH